MGRAAIAVASGAALLMAAVGCGTTSVAPDHDASADAPPGLDGDADGDVDGGFDVGPSVPMCRQSADCSSGQICCLTDTMTTECQAGPCPNLQPTGRSFQLCDTAADCFVAGDTCDNTRLPIRVCDPPIDDGGPGDAGQADVASDAGLDARGGDAAADGSGPCVPRTCVDFGYDCGLAVDNCGDVIDCGATACPGSEFCGGGGPHKCGGDAGASGGGDAAADASAE
jgi:hypothetical protein